MRFWFKLGLISFGGTMGHLAIMQDALVDKRHWISQRDFLHALDHCMLLPGPEAQELATYIGWRLHGVKGGLAAGILFVLPSTMLVLALSVVYVRFGNLPVLAAVFNGLKPAVLALILIALIKVGRKAIRGPLHVMTAAGAFLAMFVGSVPLPTILVATFLLALLVNAIFPSAFHNSKEAKDEMREIETKESKQWIGRTLKLLAVFATIWLASVGLLLVFAPDFAFWRTLALFFTKTAFVTVGGSYTVIPYVAQFSVGSLHWLSRAQMTDGFALAETTPGPLIIVLAFVGFMAAYTRFGSIGLGALGLVATTFYTFLPCFLFVFAGAPLVERTRGVRLVSGFLGLVTAVVLGAIIDLTLFLGKSILFPNSALRNLSSWTPDWVALLWVVTSFLLLISGRLKDVHLVLLSIAFGLVRLGGTALLSVT